MHAVGATATGPEVEERQAFAKVNLTLEVLGRRDDGFHEVRTVMQRITLSDTLRVTAADALSLRCSDPSLEGPQNLVWRAAELLQQECGVRRGATLWLRKRVPVAAGLGGGSADAAAALDALNALWRLGLPRTALAELGARLGSDVPFFLAGSPLCLAAGRGERLTELGLLPATWLVLVKPPVGISAGAVYQAFPRERWSDGERTRAWLEHAFRNRDVPPPFNDLEAAALTVEPRAAAARDVLRAAGAVAPVMSGSGSTYFWLADEEQAARVLYERSAAAAAAMGGEVFLERFVTL